MKQRTFPVVMMMALATLAQGDDKKPADRPARPALEAGKSYVLMLPDGTCRACPYKAKVLSVWPDGWAEFQFDKDAGPRLWHLIPEKAGAPIPPFWINTQQLAGYTAVPPEPEVKPDAKPEAKL